MGRLIHKEKNCTLKCQTVSKSVFSGDLEAFRIALEPDGNIIFQSCDGRYPVIGTYYDSFNKITKNLLNFNYKKCANEL